MDDSRTAQKLREHGHNVPINLHDGIVRYVEKGIPFGSCMNCFVSNDLFGFLHRADDEVRHAAWYIGHFFYNHTPRGCYGSDGAVKDWIKSGGIQGRENG